MSDGKRKHFSSISTDYRYCCKSGWFTTCCPYCVGAALVCAAALGIILALELSPVLNTNVTSTPSTDQTTVSTLGILHYSKLFFSIYIQILLSIGGNTTAAMSCKFNSNFTNND